MMMLVFMIKSYGELHCDVLVLLRHILNVSYIIYSHRSLHANGIDDLLVFLGSNPEEVKNSVYY